MKTSGFKEYRLKEDDKYFKDEIRALKIFNESCLKHVDLVIFGQKGTSMRTNSLSKKDKKVVLELIEWLATPVGKDYINNRFLLVPQ